MIGEINREFICAKCGQNDNSYFPYKKGGKKYCSYECQKDDGEIEISYSAKGELIIQFEGQAAKAVEDSQLSAEQKEVKNFFKANPQTSEISAKEEFRYNPTDDNRNRQKRGITKGDVLIGVVVVGIIAIIIALIVRVTGRNKD
ncbi:9561_t:CDS:2, partial [Funneliformis geosporum]